MGISEGNKRIVDINGFDIQSRQIIEEMAELTQAINKFWRKDLNNGSVDFKDLDLNALKSENLENLIEELADVSLCLNQMIYLFGCEERMDEINQRKTERQLKRMNLV